MSGRIKVLELEEVAGNGEWAAGAAVLWEVPLLETQAGAVEGKGA